jgi:acyl-coenzyme A thioesterase PaaI-like protein
MTQLPHTRGCLVCGRENPHGLHLDLFVDEETGNVSCSFTPVSQHIGFEGVIHGGVLAAVLDEAMVWVATWSGKRFCLCAEMTTRFKQPVRVGQQLRVEARVMSQRPRLIETQAAMFEGDKLLVIAVGKYAPLKSEQNRHFLGTLVDELQTSQAALQLKQHG